MDLTTAHELIELNNRFYTEHAASFSATRSAPWEGWNHAAGLLTQLRWPRAHNGGASCHSPLVLDLACGNLRFERFLLNAFPSVDLRFHAVDACADLAKDASQIPGADFYEMDVLGSFLDDWARLGDLGHTVPNRRLADAGIPECDLTVCFGFMHHVPGFDMRASVLDAIVERTALGGVAFISFWQFMRDERLARKALAADSAAHESASSGTFPLDENDHFLGWQSDPSPLRYCHHFDESEIDELVASVGTRAREVARYSADGGSGTLNRYLMLERVA